MRDAGVHRNVQQHRIRYFPLAARGAVVGVLSAVVMAIVAMAVGPLVAAGTDAWTFPRVVASLVMGESAVSPLVGFAAVPVLVGLLLHLAIGALVGAVFAVLVGLLDIEEAVPVMVFGLVYGVVVFLATWIGIGRLFFPGFEQLPLVVMLWSYVVFGMLSGLLLGEWQDRYDLDASTSDTRVGATVGS